MPIQIACAYAANYTTGVDYGCCKRDQRSDDLFHRKRICLQIHVNKTAESSEVHTWFYLVNDEDPKEIMTSADSKSTKNQVKYAVKIFEDYYWS